VVEAQKAPKKKSARTLGSFHQALLEAFETLTDYDFEG